MSFSEKQLQNNSRYDRIIATDYRLHIIKTGRISALSTKDRLMDKLFQHPIPKNFTKQELDSLMKSADANVTPAAGVPR